MVGSVHSFVAACELATKSSEVWRLYLDYIRVRGFGWCTYTYQFFPVMNGMSEQVNEDGLRKNDYAGRTWITSVSDEAKTEYLKNQYDRVDPVVEHVKTSLQPLLLGREFLPPDMPGFQEAEALFLRAEAYGVRTAYCVPLRHPSGRGHGSATLHSSFNREELLHALEDVGAEVHLATIYMHSFYQPLERREKAIQIGLKGRLFEVLSGITAGKSNKEIADELQVSEPTVSFHMNKIKKKLKAGNSREIVRAANELGLFED